MNAGKIVLGLLLLGFAFGQIARIDLGNNVAITLMDVAVGIVVGGWLAWKIKTKTLIHTRKSSLIKPISFFVSICFVSLMLNPLHLSFEELYHSAMYLVRWVVYSGVYFVIRDLSPGNKGFLKNGLIVAGALQIS